LRGKLVDEWLSNKEEYQTFLLDIDPEQKAVEFRKNWVFTGELGNMMLLRVSNVLRMSVFTAMEHFCNYSCATMIKASDCDTYIFSIQSRRSRAL